MLNTPNTKDDASEIISEISKHYARKSENGTPNKVAELRIEGSSRNEDLESVMLEEDEELKDVVDPIDTDLTKRKSQYK